MPALNSFTPAFYKRFYSNAKTRVTSQSEMYRRSRAIAALVSHLEIEVTRILDAGCGLGWMRQGLLEIFPRARYVGIEVSEHLCKELHWVHASLASYRTRTRFDLIVCYDVLQYMSDADAAKAMNNLSRLCRGVLYFHVPTIEDWNANADHSRSDSAIRLRAAQWYRTRLAKAFLHLGFGIHVRKGVEVHQWELEKAPVMSNRLRR
jgi:trans-aconitate methyltransferase